MNEDDDTSCPMTGQMSRDPVQFTSPSIVTASLPAEKFTEMRRVARAPAVVVLQ